LDRRITMNFIIGAEGVNTDNMFHSFIEAKDYNEVISLFRKYCTEDITCINVDVVDGSTCIASYVEGSTEVHAPVLPYTLEQANQCTIEECYFWDVDGLAYTHASDDEGVVYQLTQGDWDHIDECVEIGISPVDYFESFGLTLMVGHSPIKDYVPMEDTEIDDWTPADDEDLIRGCSEEDWEY
jgi:hypothetical protein